MKVLDLFCGRGGWSAGFHSEGWKCVGVDIENHGYPHDLILSDVFQLDSSFFDGFDAIVASPPCEEFARAWLPWLRCDKTPDARSLELLRWAVGLASRPRVLVECSIFAGRHVPGAVRVGSWCLWGDVPLLLPSLARDKGSKSGADPAARAMIPFALSLQVARCFRRSLDVA